MPNIVASGVALALIGMLLGPLFPILINTAAQKIKPRALRTSSLSYIASFGACELKCYSNTQAVFSLDLPPQTVDFH